MATTFNLLRATDLIWSFVINNYLLGKDPFPFDLLYWNSDSTRMPAAMHSFYLRKCYHENALVQPGASAWARCRSTCAGSICRSTGSQPARIISRPGRAPTPLRRSIAARARFVLAGSGHIAGVVNPPVAGQVRLLDQPRASTRPRGLARRRGAPRGLWWPDWAAWNGPHAGEMVPARQPGDGELTPIEDAPGVLRRDSAPPDPLAGARSQLRPHPAAVPAGPASAARSCMTFCVRVASARSRSISLRPPPSGRQHQARQQQHLLLAQPP